MLEQFSLADWGLLLGGLAFVISVITELTKNLEFLQQIPTDLEVLLLGIGGGVLAMLFQAEQQGEKVTFWLLAGGILIGIMAGFIAMYGWATFQDLWLRFCPEREERQ